MIDFVSRHYRPMLYALDRADSSGGHRRAGLLQMVPAQGTTEKEQAKDREDRKRTIVEAG